MQCHKIDPRKNTVVFAGPYEYNSNEQAWNKAAAKVIKVAEDNFAGGIDMASLEAHLKAHWISSKKVGSFTIASNVTGNTT